MLLLLTLACQSAAPSWDLLTPTAIQAPAPAPAPEPEKPVDPAFQEAIDLAAKAEDPWGTNAPSTDAGVGGDPVGGDPVGADPVGGDPVDAAPVEPVVEAPTAAPAGLAEAPAWGVRLVATVAGAQPPRAVLGLPSGEEVVVSPGSMLPEVGVLVVAIGQGSVQIARVTPAGDHATIESQSLLAQY